jgi:CBS domain-containing protein
MKVRGVYTPNLLVAYPGEALAVAASRMDYNAVGALVVKEGSHPIGILSERDVVHAAAEDRDLEGTMVAEYMTEDFVPIPLNAEVGEAAAAMVSAGDRHLPVDDRGEIVGMVSARDMLAVEGWDQLLTGALAKLDPLEIGAEP